MVEKFTCKLYGIEASNTDEARYKKFCLAKRTPEPQQLPPTRDALLCHCKRVSYVTAIVKSSLVATLTIPNPDGYGWKVCEGKIEVEWLLRPLAPETLLELVSCSCRKTVCDKESCVCLSYSLPCTDLCLCNCECNDIDEISSDEEDNDSYADDSYDDSDTEDSDTEIYRL